ncbi:MAG: hypothetical protein JXR12_05690 [Neptunomonas phycophila]|uniref:hypothetical protein n=1 Tax=Neptunomonas phycophila TaxID=1572645 RepID=UPI003B8E4EF3
MKKYQKWHLPLEQDSTLVGDALKELQEHGSDSIDGDIPLIIRMMENPQFGWLNDDLFPGAACLVTHDVIHVLLGRGMMPKDEAFVIGYTMGSTKRMTNWRTKLFCWINQSFYPSYYRFSDEEARVFEWGVACGRNCETDLSRLFVDDIIDKPVRLVRKALGIDIEMLQWQYQIEAEMYPHSHESARSAGMVHV